MSSRKRVSILIVIMAGVALSVAGTALLLLYQAALAEQRARLVVTARSQARLMEAIARHERDSPAHQPDGARAAAMDQILEGHQNYEGVGETDEFTLARRDGDSIVFLLQQGRGGHRIPGSVPFKSEFAEPMRRALSGLSGAMVGSDYDGCTVLAAHEPVAELDLGIVAKIQLAEVRAPFIRAALVSLTIALAAILIAALSFHRITNPMIAQLASHADELEEEVRERAQAQEELRQSEARYRRIADTAYEGIWTIDVEGRTDYVNRRMAEMLGYTRKEMEGRSLFEFMDDDARVDAEQKLQRRTQAVAEQHDFRFRRKDGSDLWTIVSTSPIVDEDGQITGALGMITDITERRQAEEAMLHTDKLDSLGLLAGGIAHDFNNMLTGIMGNVSLARARVADDGDVAEMLADSEEACLRARRLTQQLLTFAHGGAPIRTTASLAQLMQDSICFALRGSDVASACDIPDDLWAADIDQGQISQVINNLIINADQAMPDGGTVTVSAENVPVGSEQSPTLGDGRYVKVSIEDHGVGIPSDHLARAFDPYFTTKQKGSGLGLATAHSIVQQHDGQLTVESELGVGTTFHLYLPASDEPAPVPVAAEEDLPMGAGRILLMDDEPGVREVGARLLIQLGYEVELATDGMEAIGLYRQAMEEEQPFDAVIMDLTVPGAMGGREAMGSLLALDPDVRAIVSSGYSTDPVMARYEEHGFAAVVPKPYKIAELTHVVHRVLRTLHD